MSFSTIIKRFQFCLNSDDPSIVKLGIDSFLETCSIHGNSHPFNSTSETKQDNSSISPIMGGYFQSYLLSSPFAEEIFSVWNLSVARSEVFAMLSESLMRCFFTLFHDVSVLNSSLLYISKRFLFENEDKLQKLFSSKQFSALNYAIQAVTNCVRVLQSVPESILISTMAFLRVHHDLIQTDFDLNYSMILLLMNALFVCEKVIVVTSDIELFENIFSNLSNKALRLLLESIIQLLRNGNWQLKHYLLVSCSRNFFKKLFELSLKSTSLSSDGEEVQSIVKIFSTDLVDYCVEHQTEHFDCQTVLKHLLDSTEAENNVFFQQVWLID
jgi:hypothetical protein